MSLFTEWVNLYPSKTEAIKNIYSELGETISVKEFEDWQFRKTEIPEHIKKYMRKQAIPAVAKEHGISVDIVKKIAESLV